MTESEFRADQGAQPPYHRPHVVPLEPSEILWPAHRHWYCKGGVRNFDAVSFAQDICREYGIATYQRPLEQT